MLPSRWFRRLHGFALAIFLVGASTRELWGDEKAAPPEVLEGQKLTLRAEVEGGEAPFRYQWYRNYVPLIGATQAELTFASIQPSDAGSYIVTVSNDAGYVTSSPDEVIVRSGEPGRLANLSVVTAASDAVVVGFSLGGKDTRGATDVLARAAGPALAQFGIVGALRDPILSLFANGRLVTMNDDWGGDASLVATAAAVGAFPFATASKDSAMTLALAPASYTAEVTNSARETGITVIELYDASSGSERSRPRLVNLSARGRAGAESAPLTAGFTILGDAPVTVLVRGIGPALARLGIEGALAKPRLTLFRGETAVAANEGWSSGNADAITAAQKAVGAFALENDSADTALVLSLRPGAYNAQISSAAGSGMALVEVYEVP